MTNTGTTSLVAAAGSFFLALLGACNNYVPADADPMVSVIDGLLDDTQQRSTVRPTGALPPLVGATLAISHDSRVVAAGDADTDRVYIVSLSPTQLVRKLQLPAGAWPGRIVASANDQFALVERGNGAVLLLDRNGDRLAEQRVCAEPRGLATYQSTMDGELLYVACASGDVVKLRLAGLVPLSVSKTGVSDLRDIVVASGRQELWVSRFGSAQVVQLGLDGNLLSTLTPAGYTQHPQDPKFGGQQYDAVPTQAFRLISLQDSSALLLHQQSLVAAVPDQYYGCPDYPNCPAPILPWVTRVSDRFAIQTAVALPQAPLTVDAAQSGDGQWLAALAAANYPLPFSGAHYPAQSPVLLGKLSDLATQQGGGLLPVTIPDSTFKPIAIVPQGTGSFVIQTRGEQPGLYQLTASTGELSLLLTLETGLPVNAGRELFFAATPAGPAGPTGYAGHACASCHGEGTADQHVWTRIPSGGQPEARNTKSLLGGLLFRAPFRWTGEQPDFGQLVSDDLFNMGVAMADPGVVEQMGEWLTQQPALWNPATWKADQAQAVAGQQLFQSLGCGQQGCHSGPMFTSNQKSAFGGSEAYRVPSLLGVGLRAPLFHSGCAADLSHALDGSCAANSAGGGGPHDLSAMVSADDQQKLLAYLRTL